MTVGLDCHSHSRLVPEFLKFFGLPKGGHPRLLSTEPNPHTNQLEIVRSRQQDSEAGRKTSALESGGVEGAGSKM